MKFEKITLSEQQIKWLKKHFKHTKNDVIRERLGLSHSTLHRIARELGLKKTPQFMTKMQLAASAAGKAAIDAEDEAAKERRRQQANQNRNPERCFKKGKMVFGKMPARKTLYHQRQTSGIVAKNKASGRGTPELGTTHANEIPFSPTPRPREKQTTLRIKELLKAQRV